MPAITIRVGASLDSSMTAVLRPWIAAIKEARAAVAAEMRGVDREIQGGYRGAPAYARAGFKGAETEAKSADRAITRSADAAAKEQIAARKHVADIRSRYLADETRAEEAAAKKSAAAWKSVATASARNFLGIIRAGAGIFGQIARGAGVDFSISSLVGKGVSAEAKATQISNSGMQEGAQGANGQRQDPATILAETRAIAKATATDTNVALEGLQKFVGKTGDLETGRAVFADMAKLAKATGTSLEDMATASGDVSIALGNTPNKAKKIEEIMRVVAGQGKLGAVEVKDLASQMAKIVASAPQFKGDLADNIAILGGLTQEARQKGGATSASQAATSTAAFARDITKSKTLKNFNAGGIDVFADKSKTSIRSPEAIIEDVLKKTGGNLAEIGKFFPNAASKKTVTGFANVFNQAGGGDAGLKAVRAEFDHLKAATMSTAEVDKEFAAQMSTTASKAQVFQTNLEEIATSMANKVLPQLEKLAPRALELADALSKVLSWASGNPFEAASVALAGSIVKAGIGEVIKSSLASGMAGAGGPIAAAIASAIISYELGKLVIDKIMAAKDSGVTDSTNAEARELNAVSKVRVATEHGSISKEDKSAIENEAAELKKRIAAAQEQTTSRGQLDSFFRGDSTSERKSAKNDAEQGRIPDMIAHLAKLNALLGGTVKVQEVNPVKPTAPGGAGVDPTGRTGPGR